MKRRAGVVIIGAVGLLACALTEVGLAQTDSKVGTADIVCPTKNENARRTYNEAYNLQNEGRLAEAEKAYQKAVELDPSYCDAMDNLGRLLRGRNDLAGAISWYKRSLSVKPNNHVAHQNLAAAYLYQGNTAGAEKEYQWLIKNNPRDPEGYYGLGNLYVQMEKADAAVEPLKRAEELYITSASPYLADVRYILGIAYFQKSDYAKARDYLLLAYPEMSTHPGMNYFLGLCYLEPSIENPAKARQYILKARELGVKIPEEILRKIGE